MTRTRWQTLLAAASISTSVCLLVLVWWESRGNLPIRVPWLLAVVTLVLATLLVFGGLRVRRFSHGGAPMDPLVAARIVAFAKSGSLVGAIQAGYLAAQLILAIAHRASPEGADQLLSTSTSLGAALVLIGASLLAEWWCRAPGDDDTGADGPPGSDRRPDDGARARISGGGPL